MDERIDPLMDELYDIEVELEDLAKQGDELISQEIAPGLEMQIADIASQMQNLLNRKSNLNAQVRPLFEAELERLTALRDQKKG